MENILSMYSEDGDDNTALGSKRKREEDYYKSRTNDELIVVIRDLIDTQDALTERITSMEEDLKNPVVNLSHHFEVITIEIEALEKFTKKSKATTKFHDNSTDFTTPESWITDFTTYAPTISGLIDLLLFNNQVPEIVSNSISFGKFMILAYILSVLYPTWKSDISFNIELVHKSITQSDLGSKILSKILPAALVSRSLTRNIDQ
jgi:hypothetical protein